MKITIKQLRQIIREALGAKTVLPPPDEHGEVDPHEFYLTGIKNHDSTMKQSRETMDDRYRKNYFDMNDNETEEDSWDWEEEESHAISDDMPTLRPGSGIRRKGNEKEKIAS